MSVIMFCKAGQEAKHQRGIVIPIAAVAILVLLIIAGFFISIGNRTQIRSDLQAAADAAALGAASVVCSSKQCWNEVPDAAAKILAVHGLVAGDPGLTVTVERGRWISTAGYAAPAGFQSFENWEADTPGRPGYAAFNAVRVQLQRTGIQNFMAGILTGSLAAEVESIARAGTEVSSCAAPFAVPVCALLDSAGDFDPDQVCAADRWFTKVQRFCPAGDPGCGMTPSFQWDPAMPGGMIEGGGECTDTASYSAFNPAGVAVSYDYRCFWRPPYYSDRADNFGVVGMPKETSIVTEGQLQMAIANANTPCVTGTIVGNPFSILGSGFTQQASHSIVWDQIRGAALGGGDSAHLPYNASALGGFEVNTPLFGMFSLMNDNAVMCAGGGYCADSEFKGTDGILCNSARLGTVTERLPIFGPDGEFWNTDTVSTILTEAGQSNVWKISLPVIADVRPGAAACRGVLGQAVEQFVDPSEPWEIIGFVDAWIYDVDILDEPDSIIGFTGSGSGLEAVAYCAPGDQANTSWESRACQVFGEIPDCDLVRGRLNCGARLIVDGTTVTRPHAVMVPKL